MSKYDDLVKKLGEKKFGNAGLLWRPAQPSSSLTNGTGGAGYNQNDPRYYEQEIVTVGDAGGETRWKLKDEWAGKLAGKSQVRDPSRLINPDLVEEDPEFGILTPDSNIKSDEDWLDKYGLWGLAAIPAAGVAAGMLGGSGSGIMGGMGYEGAGMIAPGMEGIAAAESALINAGGVPGWALSGADPLTALQEGLGASEFGEPPYEPFEANYPGNAPITPGTEPNWLERAWGRITDPANLARIPGLINAINPPATPTGGAASAGKGAGGSGMGGYSPTARKPELEMNPYTKAQKSELAPMLADLLKGVGR